MVVQSTGTGTYMHNIIMNLLHPHTQIPILLRPAGADNLHAQVCDLSPTAQKKWKSAGFRKVS